jgi:hypothetical protein
MYKLKYYLLLISGLILITTCKKQDEPVGQVEYIVFGHFYGECAGEQCIEIFKLNCCHIYEDTNDFYPDQVNQYSASYIELDSKKRDSVSFLLNRVPRSLLDEKKKIIGTPDAGDWGGIYFEIKYQDHPVQYWFIDQMKTNIPTNLHSFVDDINTAIKRLQ